MYMVVISYGKMTAGIPSPFPTMATAPLSKVHYIQFSGLREYPRHGKDLLVMCVNAQVKKGLNHAATI